MDKSVVLDSEALHSIASAHLGNKAARRGQSILALAMRTDARLYVPAVVAVEVFRGTPADARISRVLKSTKVVATTLEIAKVAGACCMRTK